MKSKTIFTEKKIMSRKKHNISFIKPQEPKFLRELKAQAGFKEGPTVDTKKNDPTAFEGWDDDENDVAREKTEEKPVVVVLTAGDMTAEEAEAFKKTKEKEEANTRADLTKRIIFNRKSKLHGEETSTNNRLASKKSKQSKAILSFNDEDEEKGEDR